MAFSNIPVTPGSGTNIAVDAVSGNNEQVVKIDLGVSGSSQPLVGVSGNLPVTIAAAPATITVTGAGGMFPISAASPIPVSAPAALPVSSTIAAPVYVRISNLSAGVDTLPIAGVVTGAQGLPATNPNAWPIKISDGTNTAPLDTSNQNALKVSVIATNPIPGTQADKTAFSEGVTFVSPIAGEYNTAPTLPSSGQTAGCQITQFRGLHVNLRDANGAILGNSGNPVFVQPNGSGTQGTNLTQVGGNNVVTAINGVQKVGISDGNGNAYTNTNALPVYPAPSPGTFWSSHVAYTASQAAQAIQTPAAGKTLFVQGLIIIPTGAGTLEIFDNSSSPTADLINGTLPATGVAMVIPFVTPRPLAAINNVLRYTTGTGATGDITAYGYQA